MGGIHLTTPKDAGDLDSNDYTDVRVTHVSWNLVENILEAVYQLGVFNNGTGVFTPGILQRSVFIVRDGINPQGELDPSITDYTTFFDEKYKQGNDTNAERFLEMVTNTISLRLGLPGTAVKPGKSGKKKV